MDDITIPACKLIIINKAYRYFTRRLVGRYKYLLVSEHLTNLIDRLQPYD